MYVYIYVYIYACIYIYMYVARPGPVRGGSRPLNSYQKPENQGNSASVNQ